MKSKNILIIQFIALSFIFSFYSCNSDEKTGNQDDSFDFEDYISLTDPDKVIENVSGTLYFNNELKLWVIHPSYLAVVNDPIECFLIIKMPDNNFSFEDNKEVFINGFCYKVPYDLLFDWSTNKEYCVVAGTEVYFIQVTNLKYK